MQHSSLLCTVKMQRQPGDTCGEERLHVSCQMQSLYLYGPFLQFCQCNRGWKHVLDLHHLLIILQAKLPFEYAECAANGKLADHLPGDKY